MQDSSPQVIATRGIHSEAPRGLLSMSRSAPTRLFSKPSSLYTCSSSARPPGVCEFASLYNCSSSARPPGVCEFASRHLAPAPHDLRVCASSPRSIPAPAPSSARPPGVCESASRHLAPAPHDLRVCVSVRLMSSLLQLLTTSGCVWVCSRPSLHVIPIPDLYDFGCTLFVLDSLGSSRSDHFT